MTRDAGSLVVHGPKKGVTWPLGLQVTPGTYVAVMGELLTWGQQRPSVVNSFHEPLSPPSLVAMPQHTKGVIIFHPQGELKPTPAFPAFESSSGNSPRAVLKGHHPKSPQVMCRVLEGCQEPGAAVTEATARSSAGSCPPPGLPRARPCGQLPVRNEPS